MKKLVLGAVAALSLGVAAAPAQALVIGAADSSNSIPFGSAFGGYYFQQVYSAASFAGPLTIDTISFYSTLDQDSTTPRDGTFEIYLSTTSAAVDTFDTNNSAPWFDSGFTKVFDGVLPTLTNGRLNFSLSTAFNYAPAAGRNLLLTVRTFDGFSPGDLYLDVDRNDGVTNSRFSAYPYDWNQGLVTGFNDVAAVPEPATWALMIMGFGLAGAGLRRRQARVA